LLHADHGYGEHPGFPICVKVTRASIDIDVFEEARGGVGEVSVCCGASDVWLVVG
jgi:hypothetical protein